TDEIYEYIIFDNNEHISPAAVSANKEKVLTIGGFSKTFSITGWRLGYLCACEEIITKLGILNDLIYICAPAPLQKAVADILIQSDCTFKELKDFYQNNRDILVNTLNEIGLTPCVPEGAYYLLADISKLNCKNSRQAADMILQNTGVATVPGSAFFNTKSGERFVRFCFAKKKDILLRACEQLKKLSFF
ncbi:MAG TPA: pyridoxal phosphate-dependent aminotransferase, partial [bacterium]|nr:pyridoxal phosphate-dependent aminotransferase [bacterium]